MKTARIVKELRDFLATPGVTASDLARISGVSTVRISYLKTGKRKDCASETADRLREGMATLISQISSDAQKA